MKIKLLFFAGMLSLFACNNDGTEASTASEEVVEAATTPKEAPLTRFQYDGPVSVELIDNLINQVYDEDAKKINTQNAQQFIAACEKFAGENPNDEKSPELLIKAAETARNIGAVKYAIALYDDVLNKFPNYSKVSQALFLKAFTLENNLKKKDEAKALYQEFIQKYPNDEFAESAQFMLENIDKTNAEIIKEFEKNRQTEQ